LNNHDAATRHQSTTAHHGKIRARHHGNKNIYVHNDLSNAAFNFKKIIETKVKASEMEGIAFDCMACLLMLAGNCGANTN